MMRGVGRGKADMVTDEDDSDRDIKTETENTSICFKIENSRPLIRFSFLFFLSSYDFSKNVTRC